MLACQLRKREDLTFEGNLTWDFFFNLYPAEIASFIRPAMALFPAITDRLRSSL